MGTTALVAELLVGGVQALLTVGVMFIAVSSRPHLSDWSAVLKLQWAPAGVVAIVVAYTLGILVDRLTDSLLSPLDMKMRHRVIKKKGFSVPKARLFVMQHGDKMSPFLEYVRSRLRVARVTTVNVALLTVAIAIMFYRQDRAISVICGAIVVGSLLTALSFYTWLRITETYYKRLQQAYEVARKAAGT